MAIDNQVFQHSANIAGNYVRAIATFREDKDKIEKPFDKSSIEKVVESILKGISYQGSQTSQQLVEKTTTTGSAIDTIDEMVQVIVTSRPIINLINDYLERKIL